MLFLEALVRHCAKYLGYNGEQRGQKYVLELRKTNKKLSQRKNTADGDKCYEEK